MTPKKKAAAVPVEGPYLVEPGFNVNEILRSEPAEIAVTFAALSDPGPHLSLGRFGYLEFGGGHVFRPIGFDLDRSAVLCSRVL